jgi:hypothetical protein
LLIELKTAIRNVTFKIVEEARVVFAYGVYEMRYEKITGGLRGVTKGRESRRRLMSGNARDVSERSIRHVTIKQTFLEEAIKGGHDGGVGERSIKIDKDIANRALTAAPENTQNVGLQPAKRRSAEVFALKQQSGERLHVGVINTILLQHFGKKQ